MGGIVLHEGDIAEMKTGEGKTFVATLALYLNALAGRGTHLVTVNDYLAKRDASGAAASSSVLGMRTAVDREHAPVRARAARRTTPTSPTGRTPSSASTTCATTWPSRSSGVVQRGHAFAIVDEVDSILDRRGADAADHLRRARGGRPDLLRLRPRRAAARRVPREPGRPEGRRRGRGRRLRVRREAQDGRRHRAGRREGRARAPDRQPLRPAQLAARQPPHPGAEGGVALPARHRLRDPGRRGEDRRRVHRPDHGGPPLERGPAPGGRGEGGRPHPGRAPDDGDDHPPELLPPLREARRHDRHREDRGEGVRRDLRPQRRRDPDERARSRAPTSRTSSSRRRRASSPPSPATSRSAPRRGSRCSSARSPSRPPSTSRSS